MRLLERLCCVGLVLGAAWMAPERIAAANKRSPDLAPPVTVQPVMIAQLGSEHLANAVYRRGAQGPRIVAWGDRILQWPIQAEAPMEEVVSAGPEPIEKQLPGQYRAGRYSNGGCALDIDGDGKDEVTVARWLPSKEGTDLLWFEEVSGQPQWTEHLIARIDNDGTQHDAPHDIVPLEVRTADKTFRGVVVIIGRHRLVWYQVPSDSTEPWQEYTIATLERSQSGMSVGDLSGDGRPDVACGMFWAECPADPSGGAWQVHRYGWDDSVWAGMAKTALGDMNGDGQLDIVASEAEIPDARLAVFCRDPAAPNGVWQCTLIEKGLYCPHSLVLSDVNRDGQLDILVGEMTAGGWDFPLNPAPRVLLYLNQGHLKFQCFTLHTGWGVHEMRLAPPQPDGRIFVYAADEIQLFKFPNMKTHVVGWMIGSIE